MMKTKHLFPIVLTALALGACSDDNVAPENGNGASWNSEGKGYITLALNLPTERASRANDNFDDGLASEYQVRNATLILFAGDDEANSTFQGAYELNLNGWNNVGTDNKDQITTSTKIVQQINQTNGTQIYALVVLNDNDLLTVNKENASLTINNGSSTSITDETTWTDFNAVLTVLETSNFTGNGFLMANAPLSTVAGGVDEPTGGTVFTLADVDETKIFDNYAQASTNPAATIYVERAVAKVTVNKGSSIVDGGTTTGGGNQQYTIEGWCLDQTNTKSYLVRKVASSPVWLAYKSGGSKDHRFVGSAAIDNKYYRTYWGEDPNYTKEETGTDDFDKVEVTSEEDPFKIVFGTDNPAYCLENTFNVATQDKDKTTRVIVKAQFNGGSEFYLVNRDESTLYTKDNMENLFKAAFLNEPLIEEWLKTNVSGGASVGIDELTVLTFDEAKQAKGVMELTGVTVDVTWTGGSQPELPEGALKKINSAVGTVNYYAGGMAYYSVLIRHFDDTQAPWNTWETTDKPSVTEIYPGGNAEPNYLGRYGVLRNNWYDLTVNSIKNIGEPVVPEVDGGKDDDLDAYISVTINVLSWAKRTQDVEL